VPHLVLLAALGFGAQLVNSSLGMGYGVTSTTALLALGASPAVAAATVNVSQVGSQLVSGLAHWRLGNVDWTVVRRIGVPGAAGAFAGAAFLSWLATERAAPLMSALLLSLGAYVLVRFTVWGTPRGRSGAPLRRRFLAPLGLVGGFLNSTGGGGWGPVSTTALLAGGRLRPRTVVGSISAAEFLVVLSGSAGFAVGLGLAGINPHWAGLMLVGGLLAALPAAWLARHVPPRLLGSLIGGLIVLVNVRVLVGRVAMPPAAASGLLVASVAVWGGAIAWSARAHLAERTTGTDPGGAAGTDPGGAAGTDPGGDTGGDSGRVTDGAPTGS
jgi:hypothetical protein